MRARLTRRCSGRAPRAAERHSVSKTMNIFSRVNLLGLILVLFQVSCSSPTKNQDLDHALVQDEISTAFREFYSRIDEDGLALIHEPSDSGFRVMAVDEGAVNRVQFPLTTCATILAVVPIGKHQILVERFAGSKSEPEKLFSLDLNLLAKQDYSLEVVDGIPQIVERSRW